MRETSEDKLRKLWEVYKEQFRRSARAQKGSKKDLPKTAEAEQLAFEQFKVDLVSTKEDLKAKGAGRIYNIRVAQDLARRDVYYGSYKQGMLYYKILADLDKIPKTKKGTPMKPKGFASLFQRGKLDEDVVDDVVEKHIKNEYEKFRAEYIEKHGGEKKGVSAAWDVKFRSWYYGE